MAIPAAAILTGAAAKKTADYIKKDMKKHMTKPKTTAMVKSQAKIPEVIYQNTGPAALSSSDQVKITRMLLKADREKRQIQALTSILQSPIIQIVGTVVVCEYLEAEEMISSGWSTGIEAGAVTVVGLQALKEYGIAGLGVAAAGIGAAGITNLAGKELPGGYSYWDAAQDGLKGSLGLSFL